MSNTQKYIFATLSRKKAKANACNSGKDFAVGVRLSPSSRSEVPPVPGYSDSPQDAGGMKRPVLTLGAKTRLRLGQFAPRAMNRERFMAPASFSPANLIKSGATSYAGNGWDSAPTCMD